MISFFSKNKYLVDLLEGFTDFHNHLLPGIDDGASSVEDSLQMLNKFKEFGVKNFVATPHVMGDYYPNTPESINTALKELRAKLPSDISINAAAEYMMDQHLLKIIEDRKLLPVTENYLLVEMSYFQQPINLTEILFKLQTKAYKPILAHPERYGFYHSKGLKQYKDLKSRGCRFQLNMLSISGHYGTGMQKTALQLLENGYIDFISSDAHRLNHLEKLAKITLNKKQVQWLEPVIENSKNLFNN